MAKKANGNRRKPKTKEEPAKPNRWKRLVLFIIGGGLTTLVATWAGFARNAETLKKAVFPNSFTTVQLSGDGPNAFDLRASNTGVRPSNIAGIRLIFMPQLPIKDVQLQLSRDVRNGSPIIEPGVSEIRVTAERLFGSDGACKQNIEMLLKPDVRLRLEVDVNESGPHWLPFFPFPGTERRELEIFATDIKKFILERFPDYEANCSPPDPDA